MSTERSELPRGWSWARFSDVATVASNLVPPDKWPDMPHIAPDNIQRDTGRLLGYKSIAEDGVTSPKHYFRAGQLIYSKIRPYLNKCVRVDFDGLCSADMYPLDSHIDPAFLHHYILTRAFVSAVEKAAGSRTVLPKTNQKQLAGVPVPVPPFREQRSIAEALDSYVSRLDDAVATLERIQRDLKRYRASVLKAAVEGRLVPTEAELARKEGRDHEPASVVLAATEPPPRPARYKSRSRSAIPGHAALSVGPLNAPLPEGWVGTPLADVARLESGHTPSRKHPEWWGGDIRWIGIKDARAHHGGTIRETLQRTNEDGLANSAARLLPAQTVCLSRTASVGYVVVMGRPMATSQDFVNWICTPAIDPHWLRIVLLADRDALQRFGKGTTHTTIYFPEVLSLHVALPPLAEQRRIVAEVDRLLSVGDQTAAAASASLRRISRLRQSILNWAFEGKLVDQDPNDEPASVLLERIKAGREKIRAAAKAEKKPGRTKRRKKPA